MNVYDRLLGVLVKWKKQKLEEVTPVETVKQELEVEKINFSKESKMSIVNDLTGNKNLVMSEFEKISSSIEGEVDKMMVSMNNISARSFKEVESVFSVVESHLSADARLGLEEAKKIVAEIRAKL